MQTCRHARQFGEIRAKKGLLRWSEIGREYNYPPEQSDGRGGGQFKEAGSRPWGDRPILTKGFRIFRTSSAFVITARTFMGEPQRLHSSGFTSYTFAISLAYPCEHLLSACGTSWRIPFQHKKVYTVLCNEESTGLGQENQRFH